MGPSSCKQFLVKLTFSYKLLVFYSVIVTFTDKQQCCIICKKKKKKSRNTIIYKYSAKSPPGPGRVRAPLVWGGRPQPGSAWLIRGRKKTGAGEDESNNNEMDAEAFGEVGSLGFPHLWACLDVNIKLLSPKLKRDVTCWVFTWTQA